MENSLARQSFSRCLSETPYFIPMLDTSIEAARRRSRWPQPEIDEHGRNDGFAAVERLGPGPTNHSLGSVLAIWTKIREVTATQGLAMNLFSGCGSAW